MYVLKNFGFYDDCDNDCVDVIEIVVLELVDQVEVVGWF